MNKQWLFLDAERGENLYSFTVQEMARSLRKAGTSSTVLKLWGKGGMYAKDIIKKHIHIVSPDVIVWIGQDGWEHYDTLKQHHAKKINLWFDDPIQRIGNSPHIQQAMSQAGKDVSIFVWDRYWGEMLKSLLGCEYFPVDLAADPEVFVPCTRPLSDEAVFIGSLHSPNLMWKIVNDMPEIFQRFINTARDVIRNAIPIIPSWDKVMDATERVMEQGEVSVFAQQCKAFPNLLQLTQGTIWMMSKNEARVRLLREAVKVTPVLMFSEMRQRNHASLDELQGMVGEWNPKRFSVIDTSDLAQDCLGQLYHHGKIHLQATDPQSVYSGIPYRVFQTAASGRALFTDQRLDWNNSFDTSKELIVYGLNIAQDLSEALADTDKLEAIGEMARARFEKQHTWEKRMIEIEMYSDLGSREKIFGADPWLQAMRSLAPETSGLAPALNLYGTKV